MDKVEIVNRKSSSLGSLWDFILLECNRGYCLENDEKEYSDRREKVYNFIKIPLKVERFMLYGICQCVDSFLFVYTFLPSRALVALKSLICSSLSKLKNNHEKKYLSAAEICDLLKMAVLITCLMMLLSWDTSMIYHVVKSQSIIKLYIFFNMLEVGDKLFSSFGQDILDALFWTATEPKTSQSSHFGVLLHFIIAVFYVFLHSILVLCQATILNIAINSKRAAFLPIMMSNNFIELNGSVFKKFNKTTLFQLACSDVRERFHLFVLLLIVVVQTMKEYQWTSESFWKLMLYCMYVMISEIIIDWTKHAFITRFNEINLSVYSDYLLSLAYDTAQSYNKKAFTDHSDSVSRRMGFIPIPLGVVIIKVSTRCVSIDGQLVSIVLLLSTLTCIAALKIFNLVFIIGRACKIIDLDKTFKIFLLYSDEECINILINILINTNNTNILSSINWESEFKNLGIEAAASRLQTILITLIEQYVPVHIFRRSTFPKWATLKLKNLIIDKKIAHKKLKQFGTMHYRHRFSLLRAQVKLESRLAYESYLSKINTSLQKDPRQFWSFINNRRNTSGIPNVMHYGDIITSDVDIANLFALLFNSVYKSPLPPIHWNSENIGIKLFTFLPSRLTIDPDEVEENLSSLRTTKSRGHDGISAQLLYLLLYVFNLSLAEGVFPSIWKTSQVTPIYKSGDPGSVSNYRPFSGLPLIGKLFEKIVNKCIERRFKLVLSTNQHGFYGGRPTTTSALEFSAFIRDSFKNMSQVDVIFTDISKAFDSISHIVLINILDRLGVGEPLLSWFKSYITGRRQFVSLFNQKSAEYLVTSGVPKDGHLSPLLFNILINTLCESVDCKMLLFADDVKLFSCVQSESDAISLQESLNKLSPLV
ncbi:hypothetical protein QTP88_011738 [Uroleucon formosanum]